VGDTEMERTVLIMADGQGERFWPSSRKRLPKQFLCLTDEKKTMIQLTADRVRRITGMENVFVVTNRDYRDLVIRQIPDLPEENILCEPVGRNTAPCVALGAAHIARKYGDALMAVLPADHLVKIPALFQDALEEAFDFAERGGRLLTIGITPSSPEEGYGYIRFQPARVSGRVYKVSGFVEKPDREKAKEYVASGEYLWNSGMFVWKASTILDSLNRYLPEMKEGLGKIRESIGTDRYPAVLEECFSAFPSISVDYGILEKAENIYTLAGNFGWDDVGSWAAVARIRPTDENGNTLQGNVITADVSNTIIRGKDHLIAAAGIRDLVIVDADDVILVCGKDKTGEILSILRVLRDRDLRNYL